MTDDDITAEIDGQPCGKETMRRLAIQFGKSEEEFEAHWAEFVATKRAMEEKRGKAVN